MRCAEETDAVLFALVLEPGKVLLPGDEVVDLLEIDAAAEVPELRLELEAPLLL